MNQPKNIFTGKSPSDEDKLIYVCGNINDLSIEQRKSCVQMILGEDSIIEKDIKEVGEGLMIQTSILTKPLISALFTFIKSNLSFNINE